MSRQDRHEHDRALELAALAIDYGLTAAQSGTLDAHLVTCPACARSAAAMRGDAVALRPRTMPLPSRRVDDAVFAAIAGRRATSPNLLVLVAAALLLVALLGVAAAAGTLLLRTWRTQPTLVGPVITPDMSADEVVTASMDVYRDPPPFTLKTTLGPPEEYRTNWYTACGNLDDVSERRQIYWRYLFDGRRFRQECRYGGDYVGGFEVLTPDGHGTYDFHAWKTVTGPFLGRPADAPPATPLWLNWVNVGAADDANAGRSVRCDAWILGPVEDIAEQPARVVSCGVDRYWVDMESGFLVKRERGGEVLSEALELSVGTKPDASQFAMLGTDFTTSVEPGKRPAAITLPTYGGGTWSSDSLRGRPTAVLIQTDCIGAGCLPFDDFVAAVAARADRLQAAVIAFGGHRGFSAPQIAAAEAAGIPLLHDDESGWPRWGLPLGVALFDADGTVRSVVDPHTPASLAAVLDAFVSGQSIPVPPPWDGQFTVGEPVSVLYGQLVGGGSRSADTFDLAKLAGRPVVVTVGLLPQRDGTWTNDPENARAVAAMAGARRGLGDQAAFVLLGGPEATTEALETWTRLLAAEGLTDADVSVIVSEDSWGRWATLSLGPAGSIRSARNARRGAKRRRGRDLRRWAADAGRTAVGHRRGHAVGQCARLGRMRCGTGRWPVVARRRARVAPAPSGSACAPWLERASTTGTVTPTGSLAGRVAAALAAGGRLADVSHVPNWWTLASPDNHGVDIAAWPDFEDFEDFEDDEG